MSSIFKKFPEIELKRIKLIQITSENHITNFYEMRKQKEAAEHNGFEPYTKISQAEEFIQSFAEGFKNKQEILWGIVIPEDNKLIGYVRVGFLSTVMLTLGYGLNKDYWNKGYMSEALVGLVDFLYANTLVNRIQATVTMNNTPSIKLLEKHFFQREGILRNRVFWKGEFKDLYMYALIKEDWEKVKEKQANDTTKNIINKELVTIPTDYDQITTKYLTKILTENGFLTKGEVTSFSFEKDKIGVNSRSGHYKLTYSNGSKGEKPVKIFIKLNQKGIGAREVEFYRYIKENKVDLDIFVECYFAKYDEETQNAIIVLKDYKELHNPPIDLAAFIPRKNVPDDEPYKNMLEAIAKMHAYWWEDNSLFDKKYNIDMEEWTPDGLDFDYYKKLWDDFYLAEKAWLPNSTVELFEHAVKNFKRIWKEYRADSIIQNKHFTMLNGDCYFHQFLCLKPETDVKVKMIDLDMVLGNPAFDLTHQFMKKLNPAQRNHKDREKKLLKYYHNCLIRFGVKNYLFEELILDYRVEVFYLIFFALWDYSYQGSDDPYWWYKFQNVNHAFIDLKCDDL